MHISVKNPANPVEVLPHIPHTPIGATRPLHSPINAFPLAADVDPNIAVLKEDCIYLKRFESAIYSNTYLSILGNA
jgi:hypothetical protein